MTGGLRCHRLHSQEFPLQKGTVPFTPEGRELRSPPGSLVGGGVCVCKEGLGTGGEGNFPDQLLNLLLGLHLNTESHLHFGLLCYAQDPVLSLVPTSLEKVSVDVLSLPSLPL